MTGWSSTSPRLAPLPTLGGRGTVRDRLRSRRELARHLDWVLMGAVLMLCLLGTLLVWSATRPHLQQAGLDPQSYLKKHLLNLAIGLVLGAATTLVDYRIVRAYAPFVYVASCIGLLAVLTPLGSTVNGAHSWIVIGGGFQIQPAEFAKVGLVVSMAMLLGEVRDAEYGPRDGDVLLALIVAGVPMLLVMLQPDLGTVLVLVFLVLGMLAVSGARARWLVGLVLAGVLVGFIAVQGGLLKQYQLARLTAFANPHQHTQSVAYTQTQARIAIGSGGIFGKGLFHGSQTNGEFIPEQQTDFIFTVAGEELGLVGAGGIVLLVGLVMWRGLRIAQRSEDRFGTLVATGVVCWFAFQAFENIGMTMGIMPVTGIPLPFVSYGGSAMFADFMAVGLLQNVHLHRSM